MKARKGYIRDKTRTSTCKWLKWYFAKRTAKKPLSNEDIEELEDYYNIPV